MKRTLSLNTFRKLERAEETMMRASMPRTAVADAAPLTSDIRPAVPHHTFRAPVSFTTKRTFTLAEVARG